MKNRIYDALTAVKTEEALKEITLAYLEKRVYARKRTTFKRFTVAFASLLLLFFACLSSYFLYFTGTAYIDIDVNPSVELTLNRFNRVIHVYAYNADGAKVVDRIQIEHKPYKEALEVLIAEMKAMGYIRETELFTATLQIADSRKEEEVLNMLRASIALDLQTAGKLIQQEVFSVDSTMKMNALEQNLSPAKYLAILDLQEVDETATFDECRNHSIYEIRQETHAHMQGEHAGNENGGSHGHSAGAHGDTSGNNAAGNSGNGSSAEASGESSKAQEKTKSHTGQEDHAHPETKKHAQTKENTASHGQAETHEKAEPHGQAEDKETVAPQEKAELQETAPTENPGVQEGSHKQGGNHAAAAREQQEASKQPEANREHKKDSEGKKHSKEH